MAGAAWSSEKIFVALFAEQRDIERLEDTYQMTVRNDGGIRDEVVCERRASGDQ